MLFLTEADLATRSEADTKRDRIIVIAVVFIVGLIFCAMRLRHIAELDFPCFYVAGKLAGNPQLYNFEYITRFEASLGYQPEVFPYPPAVAALFAPLAGLRIEQAYIVYSCVLSLCGAAATWLLIERFRLKPVLSGCVILGWIPCITNFAAAQTSIVAFLCAILLLRMLEQRAPMRAGLLAGAALFKPTFGIFFVLWLTFERRWKAAGIAALTAIAWYIASVPASGGDWAWPAAVAHVVRIYQPLDFAATVWLHVGIFSPLTRLHVPAAAIACVIAVLWAAAAYSARRLPTADRFFLLLALIPALSPHPLLYDAVFTLPALLRMLQIDTRLARAWFYFAYFTGAMSLAFAHPIVNPALLPVVLTPIVYIVVLRSVAVQRFTPIQS